MCYPRKSRGGQRDYNSAVNPCCAELLKEFFPVLSAISYMDVAIKYHLVHC